MSFLSDWDILYIVRQAALLSLYPILPLIVFALLGRRRYLWKWCAGSYLGTLIAAVAAIAVSVSGLYASGLPYTPFRVGPSGHSILEMFYVFLVSLWLPSFAILGLLLLGMKLKRKTASMPLAMLCMTAYFAMAGSIWTVFLFNACGYTNEDTVWAEDFSPRKWKDVKEGMTRREVIAIVGLPISSIHGSELGSEVLLWSDFYSTGYRAKAEIKKGKVVSVDNELKFHRYMD